MHFHNSRERERERDHGGCEDCVLINIIYTPKKIKVPKMGFRNGAIFVPLKNLSVKFFSWCKKHFSNLKNMCDIHKCKCVRFETICMLVYS